MKYFNTCIWEFYEPQGGANNKFQLIILFKTGGWKLSGLLGSDCRHHRISLPKYLMKWATTYLSLNIKKQLSSASKTSKKE